MKINRETCRGFWNRNKGAIIAGGAVLLGLVFVSMIPKETPASDEELSDASWKHYCDKNNLLYDSGLPVFADEAKFIVYRDAVEPEDIKLFKEEDGFTIIDREEA